MTAEELNWLFPTIKDAAKAERFVLAQNGSGSDPLAIERLDGRPSARTAALGHPRR